MTGIETAALAAAAIGTATAVGTTIYTQQQASKAAKNMHLPTPEPVKALPFEDSETSRKAKQRAMATLASKSGRQSTLLTDNRLGDDSQAETRSGGAPILTGMG